MAQKELTKAERLHLAKVLEDFYEGGGGRSLVEIACGEKTDGSTAIADTEAGRKLRELQSKLA